MVYMVLYGIWFYMGEKLHGAHLLGDYLLVEAKYQLFHSLIREEFYNSPGKRKISCKTKPLGFYTYMVALEWGR